MEASPSTQDLERAIRELDGMYKDLSESYRRHSQAENFLTVPKISGFDDDDYDVPRPAEGLFNTTPRMRIRPEGHHSSTESIEIRIPVPTSPESHYDILPKSPKSPTTSFRSEYSSGLGTLPKENEFAIPIGVNFPGPPQFEAPPPPVPPFPHSDSDYDEVASDSSESSDPDTFVYSYPRSTKRKASSDSHDYAVVRKTSPLSHDIIRVDDAETGDADSSDYADVYSVPNSQRASLAIQELVQDSQTAERTPMVVQMKRIDNPSVKVENETLQQRENKVEEHSFITPQVEIKQCPPRETNKVPPFPNDVTQSELSEDETSNVDKLMQQTKRPSSSTRPHSSEFSGPPSYRSGTIRTQTSMDTEAQEGTKRGKGPDRCCVCKAAVPLMSVAVILCIALFMGVIIGFAYIGLTGLKGDLVGHEDKIIGGINTTEETPTTASGDFIS